MGSEVHLKWPVPLDQYVNGSRYICIAILGSFNKFTAKM